ncbi:MAG: hypothetical protein ABEI86_12960 [Halobacteriaceae archaeon]
MSKSDNQLLKQTWQIYSEEFSNKVGAVVTPDERVDSERAIDWGVQVFMLGYALGSLAGAHSQNPSDVSLEIDEERMANVVDNVIQISSGDQIPISSTSIKSDFRRE